MPVTEVKITNPKISKPKEIDNFVYTPKSIAEHRKDVSSTITQLKAEAIRKFEQARIGEDKDGCVAIVDRLLEWQDRLN